MGKLQYATKSIQFSWLYQVSQKIIFCNGVFDMKIHILHFPSAQYSLDSEESWPKTPFTIHILNDYGIFIRYHVSMISFPVL